MNNKVKFLILLAALVVLIGGAVLAYNSLDEKFDPDTNISGEEEIEQAKDFTVINGIGKEITLSENFGKPIVVNFWATWCGPCVSELPYFNDLYEEYKDDVTFMMVNMTDGYQEKLEDVKKFMQDNSYSFPVYYDTNYSAANAYRVSSIPMSLFIESSGEIEDTHLGAMSEAVLENYINTILLYIFHLIIFGI